MKRDNVVLFEPAEARRRQAEKLVDEFLLIDEITSSKVRQSKLLAWRLQARAFRKRFGLVGHQR